MSRSLAVKFVVGGGVLLCALVWWSGRQPAKMISTMEQKAGANPASSSPDKIIPPQKDLGALPAPARPLVPFWQDQLFALQAVTNSLFGASADDFMKELQTFAEGVDIADLPDILKKLQELQAQKPTVIGRDLELRLLRRWSGSDARSAAEWAAQTPPEVHDEALMSAAGDWAKQDLAAATAWAGQLPADGDRQNALKSVAGVLAYSDPQKSLALAAALPADSGRDEIITCAAGIWAANAPKDAAAWAVQIPDDTLRLQVVSATAMSWGDSDSSSAANLAINSLPAGEVQNKTVLAIVQRWGLKDAAAASAWVAQFPQGDLRQAAMDAITADKDRSRPPAF
ncbi:MAG TPA: hypothetical protein VK815_11705 [Candidatus Acidoferrales bacterium]|jgi:hypothetical protein|nr:hypothetical protein [Candidatus Acidoferrales bacterium]